MENNQFLIPANIKRGKLILNIFRPIDLGIFLTGVIITFALLLILSSLHVTGWWNILAVFPGLIAIGLVVPIPNYHNVLVCIGEIINYYSNNREYIWRGWCAVYESEREQIANSKSKQETTR